MREVDQIDTIVQVVTPENIAFEYQIAGPFRRGAALALDLVIRFAVFLAGMYLVIYLTFFSGGSPAFSAFLLIWWFVLDWFYGGFCEAYWNGQTPGKRALGLRVLTIDGQPINGVQAVLRNILRYVDTMPMLSIQVIGAMLNETAPPAYLIPTCMIGIIAMSCNSRFQRCGDIVCGTMVIQENRQRFTGMAQLEDPRVTQLAEYIPFDFRVTRSLAQTLATYVERRRFISPQLRTEIADHLASPLRRRFQFPSDTSADLLLCALYYRTFVASHGDVMGEDLAAAQNPFRSAATASAAQRVVGSVS